MDAIERKAQNGLRMSAQITDVSGGVITLKVSGKLQEPQLTAAQNQVAEIINKQGKVRILAIAEDFKGWAREGNWADVSFSWNYDSSIEKMAIVADGEWETLALAFTAKGFREFPIEFFEPRDLEKARVWLASGK
jgi:hypothetical protein